MFSNNNNNKWTCYKISSNIFYFKIHTSKFNFTFAKNKLKTNTRKFCCSQQTYDNHLERLTTLIKVFFVLGQNKGTGKDMKQKQHRDDMSTNDYCCKHGCKLLFQNKFFCGNTY